jgi:signal peptidase I
MDLKNVFGKPWRGSVVGINILIVAGLVAIWIAFAPVNLGGQISYVLVNGTSMEPGFHPGDLAIVRLADDYQVGDVVTYRNAEIGANVIHRIIAIDQDHFVIKGDNNDWVDGYQPTRDEIIGKLWIHLPKLGAAVEWVRTPLPLALAAGLIGGFFMVNTTMQKPNKNAKKQKQPAGNPVGRFEIAIYTFGVLSLGFLVLAIFAFSRPLTRPAEKITYEQNGVFSYSAAGNSQVYDSGSVRSGEPVFTKLTCTLNLNFTYTLNGARMSDISGSQQLYALLLDSQSGWKRTLPLTSEDSFSENTYENSATLDLCQVQTLLTSLKQQTGFNFSNNSLVIVAHSTVSGKISGQAFTDSFEPRLTFNFDPIHLSLSVGTTKTDPLKIVQAGSLINPALLDNTIQLAGLTPSVKGLRLGAVIGLAISLDVLLMIGLYLLSLARRNPEHINLIKYSPVLIDIYDQRLKIHPPIIDVTSMDALSKIAERQNAMILHLPCEHANYYLVQSGGINYRFVSGKSRKKALA